MGWPDSPGDPKANRRATAVIEQVRHVGCRAAGVFQPCPVDIAQPAERAVGVMSQLFHACLASNPFMINLICYIEQIRIKLQRKATL